METCSPAGQIGAERGRAQVDLKADFKMGGNQAWVHTRMVENSFNHCAVPPRPGKGARAGRKQGRAGGPHWPQPVHQVTKVDVVQKSQPSTMDMLPACLKGHVAMLGQRQDLSSSWYLCLQPQKEPRFSQWAGVGETEPCLCT